MAYERRKPSAYPGPVTPRIPSIYIPNSAAETNIPVAVPWDNCQLTYAQTVVLSAIDNTGPMEIDLEIDAAGGTEIGSITVAQNESVGAEDEVKITAADAEGLSSNSKINIEVDGSAAAAGAVMLYLYFE